MHIHNAAIGTNGDKYIPASERDGNSSVVWFTRDLSTDGLRRAVAKVADRLDGRIAIKIHTGEKDGPNIIPRPWVAELVAKDLPEATIVKTNTYYAGDRDTTEMHRDTIAHVRLFEG